MFETGHFASLWQQDGDQARARRRARSRPTGAAASIRPRSRRSSEDATSEHAIKAVCVVHNETSTGVDQPHRRDPQGDRRGGPPGALHGRHDLLARLDRLPPRRMGRGRHRRGLAERADAPAGPVVQLRQREGAQGLAVGEAAALLLELGRDALEQQDRLLPVHARRPTCSTACTRRCRCSREEGLPNVFARHARHAEATRRAVRAWGLEILCNVPEEQSSSLTAVMMPAGHDADRAAQDHPRGLRHVARHRPRPPRRKSVSHRASRRFQRPHARRHARRRRRWASSSPECLTRRAACWRPSSISPRALAPRPAKSHKPLRRRSHETVAHGRLGGHSVRRRCIAAASPPSPRGNRPSRSRSSSPPEPAARPTRWRG